MADSPLVTVEIPSPNNSGKRLYPLTRITPHCFVGQVTAQRGLEVFVPESKEASANYVVGYDGQIGQGVPEDTRSWCSSSKDNDNRAITIEVAFSPRMRPRTIPTTKPTMILVNSPKLFHFFRMFMLAASKNVFILLQACTSLQGRRICWCRMDYTNRQMWSTATSEKPKASALVSLPLQTSRITGTSSAPIS